MVVIDGPRVLQFVAVGFAAEGTETRTVAVTAQEDGSVQVSPGASPYVDAIVYLSVKKTPLTSSHTCNLRYLPARIEEFQGPKDYAVRL